MEKETVLILLLLKPMTKTSDNDIAIMIYHGGYPVLKKYQFLDFCHYFDENNMKDKKIKEKLYYY